jgi:predicted ATPase with chaperone activity
MDIFETKTGKIPEQEIRLETIKGMDAPKRALEVALAGAHGIVFLYNSNSQAVELVRAGKRIAKKHRLPFHGLAYPVCKCGKYASNGAGCTCKLSSVRRHLAKLARRLHQFDIWFDACRVKPAGMDCEPGESEETLVQRILTARRNYEIVGQPDKDAMVLLNAWQTHIGRACDTERILRVAQTIARLDGTGNRIESHHAAEAIQYQASSISWLWDSIEPHPTELRT